MVLDTTQQIGWAYEATPETDPINATNALYWKFGVRTFERKDLHPGEKHEWIPIYQGGTRNPVDAVHVKSTNPSSIGYYPTNGVGPFLVLGDSGTAGGVHTVVNIDSGELPTFTVRSESTGGTVAKYIGMVGCKAQMISGLINFMGEWQFLSEVLVYNGIKTAINAGTSLNEVHTTGTMHPTTDYTMTAANQKSDRYKRDSGTTFSWDSDAMIADLAMFNYSFINHQTIGHVNNQTDTEYIDEGNYQFLVSFSMWRGNTNAENIFTDYYADAQKDMIFKIFNNATDYRQYTWTNVALTSCDMIYAMGEERKLYHLNGFAEDFSLAVKDGCDDTYYED